MSIDGPSEYFPVRKNIERLFGKDNVFEGVQLQEKIAGKPGGDNPTPFPTSFSDIAKAAGRR